MSVRRIFAGLAVTAVSAASLSIAVPAHADPAAGYVPQASDIIGVGSDTSEHALNYLAEGHAGQTGWNATGAANKLVSWNAKAPQGAAATINLPGNAAATRPNGSGNGMKTLYGATEVADIDFARSSSALGVAEKSAGLQAFPFAKDSLAMATAKSSNAPATLTVADVVKIYDGTYTNWSQLSGTSGVIKPLIPQSGSGTRSFFLAQLKAANGGNDVVLAGSVVEVQEHDAGPVQNDANAVAPFSVGRNDVIGAPLRIEGGFSAARALYNVVRQADVAKPELTAVFGKDGFVCSPEAKGLIEAAGFDQLATPTAGGVCGVPTQDATTNLTTAQVLATTTTLTAASAQAGQVDLSATITAGEATPSGTVRFYLNGSATAATAPVPLTGGVATAQLNGVAPGEHTVVAKFTPSLVAYQASESAPVAVTVRATTPAKAKTSLAESFKASYKKGVAVRGVVTVKEKAAGTATGKIVVKRGAKVVGTGTLKGGKVTLTLKGLKKGKNTLTASYAGSTTFVGSKLTFAVTVK